VVVTPNTVEAGLLLGTVIGTVDEAVDAARALAAWGPRHVVVTGGRRPGDRAIDVVVGAGKVELLTGEWIDTPNVRGSGDTLSAAIAAGLAKGVAAPEAIRAAHRFTAAAIRRASHWRLGAGQGPLDQLGFGQAVGSGTTRM
jgi:hydroxymethylpyrimidine/phosphomethylpyrimidine kinase